MGFGSKVKKFFQKAEDAVRPIAQVAAPFLAGPIAGGLASLNGIGITGAQVLTAGGMAALNGGGGGSQQPGYANYFLPQGGGGGGNNGGAVAGIGIGLALINKLFPNSDLAGFANSKLGTGLLAAYGINMANGGSFGDFSDFLGNIGLSGQMKDIAEQIITVIALSAISDKYAENAYTRLKEIEESQMAQVQELRDQAKAMYPTEQDYQNDVAQNLANVEKVYGQQAEEITRRAAARGMGEQAVPQIARVLGEDKAMARLGAYRQADEEKLARQREAFNMGNVVAGQYEPLRRAREEEYYKKLETIPNLANAIMQQNDPNAKAMRDLYEAQAEYYRNQANQANQTGQTNQTGPVVGKQDPVYNKNGTPQTSTDTTGGAHSDDYPYTPYDPNDMQTNVPPGYYESLPQSTPPVDTSPNYQPATPNTVFQDSSPAPTYVPGTTRVASRKNRLPYSPYISL